MAAMIAFENFLTESRFVMWVIICVMFISPYAILHCDHATHRERTTLRVFLESFIAPVYKNGMTVQTLTEAARDVLTTSCPADKCNKTRAYARQWREGMFDKIGLHDMPMRPARPQKPELRDPTRMPKRRKAGSRVSKVALLHALSHIELNAVDLAWDIMGRFAGYAEENAALNSFTLPRDFFDDWIKVADDEAKHFLMLQERMAALDAAYGDLPAHDGLWESAEKTAHDFAARLAIVPMVLEARGLDVTPAMIEVMTAQGDLETAQAFQIIHDDEITHVRAGTRWFDHWCAFHKLDGQTHWQDLVQTYFNGSLKRPFNHPSRAAGGMLRDWYEPLADIPANLQFPLRTDTIA